MKTTLIITCFLLGAIGAWAQSGMDLYLDKCVACHGPDGAGKTARVKKLKVIDVRKTAPKMKAEEMMRIVANGKAPDMDSYGEQLSQDHIKAVVDYYRGLAK